MERGISKNDILTALTRSPHSALESYIPVGTEAARQEPEFLAHLISFDALKGSVRDSKIALPIVSLAVSEFSEPEFLDNSLAHLANLTPRELLTAYKFAQGYVKNKEEIPNPSPDEALRKRYPMVRAGGWRRFLPRECSAVGFLAGAGRMSTLDRLVSRYLHFREDNSALFQRNVLNFRDAMKSLYAASRTRPSGMAREILYNRVYPAGSALQAIKELEHMDPREAAAAILEHRIPFLSLFPILKKKVQDPVLLMAVIERMSPSDLQTNMANLEKLGVSNYPETRAALAQGLSRLEKAVKQVRGTTLKTGRAAESVTDEKLKARLDAVQEKQIDNMTGLQGNWLVLGDRSPSMQGAVEVARMIAGTIARFVKDQVALVFFDSTPQYYDVTGKSMEEILQITRHVQAGGSGTSIGCGLLAAMDRGLGIHGIIVVSDGEENSHPRFANQYLAMKKKFDGREVPVYYYKVLGRGADTFRLSMDAAGIPIQFQDLRGVKVDAYSIPNLIQGLRVNRYSVLDEILESRLLSVESILGPDKKGELVTI